MCVRVVFHWRSGVTSGVQPRSGERMQPEAQAVGCKRETIKPQRGERIVLTHIFLTVGFPIYWGIGAPPSGSQLLSMIDAPAPHEYFS